MSEMEGYRGRLIPVDLGGLELDEWVQKTLDRTELPEYCEDWLEALYEFRYNDFVYDVKTSTIYEVQRQPLDPYGFIEAERNADGSVSFLVSYYNGGASFGEVAETVLRKVE